MDWGPAGIALPSGGDAYWFIVGHFKDFANEYILNSWMHGEVCHTNKAMPPQPSSIIVTRFGHQGVLPEHDKQNQPILCVWESGYKQINACSLKRLVYVFTIMESKLGFLILHYQWCVNCEDWEKHAPKRGEKPQHCHYTRYFLSLRHPFENAFFIFICQMAVHLYWLDQCDSFK